MGSVGQYCYLPTKFQQSFFNSTIPSIVSKSILIVIATDSSDFSNQIRESRRKGVCMSTQIGKVFTEIIKKRRLTLKEISKATGVPATTLSEWQSNRTPKNPSQVREVAKFLGVSLHYLLFGEEDGFEPIQKILKEDIFQGTFEITVKRLKVE